MGPLEGFRILDLSTMITGPMATQMLAEQGADVIRVEPVVPTDLLRDIGPERGGVSAIQMNVNRAKRSLAIDLKNEQARAAFEKLVATADVMLQNFRPGTAERLGLGYEAINRIRPEIIYASITGFGTTGPYAAMPVYDPVIQAVGGMVDVQGADPKLDGTPRFMRSILCDKTTAMTMSQALTAALLSRERTGKGQQLELTMIDAAIAFNWCDVMWSNTFVGEGATESDDLADAFEARKALDGYVLAIPSTLAQFRGMCVVLDLPDLADDPRFQTPQGLFDNREEIRERLNAIIATRQVEELCAALIANNVPCAPVVPRGELHANPQVAHLGSVLEGDHPLGGRVRYPRHPTQFHRTPAGAETLAPRSGQHTRELLEEAGLSVEEVEGLASAGAVALG